MPKRREFELPPADVQREILKRFMGRKMRLVIPGDPFRPELVISGNADGTIEIRVEEESWAADVDSDKPRSN